MSRPRPQPGPPLPPPADLQWVSQIGWADPASHEVGKKYADHLEAVLYPLSGEMHYINGFDAAEGGLASAPGLAEAL